MKKDIQTRDDIQMLVNAFYEKVRDDDTIGFFFTQVVPVNWEQHLPKMYDFWESILFGGGKYKGEPMTVHKHVSHLHRMEPVHFERWLQLFKTNADELFSGPKTEEIKQRASSIASIMQWKVSES
ncbi:MAG: hypothetical protein Fur0041_15050 [Bacteroidia bacterium]